MIDRSVRKARNASTTPLLSTIDGSVSAHARHAAFPSQSDGCTASVYETRWTKRVVPTTMVPMATKHWPLFDLRITSERLVLRPLADDDFDALIEAVDAGIHDPDASPFLFQWADEEPVQRARNALQYWWGRRASWTAADWALGFGVWVDGRLVGVQEIEAKQFLVLREVSTGSWLTQSAQGRGIGKKRCGPQCCRLRSQASVPSSPALRRSLTTLRPKASPATSAIAKTGEAGTSTGVRPLRRFGSPYPGPSSRHGIFQQSGWRTWNRVGRCSGFSDEPWVTRGTGGRLGSLPPVTRKELFDSGRGRLVAAVDDDGCRRVRAASTAARSGTNVHDLGLGATNCVSTRLGLFKVKQFGRQGLGDL